MTFNVEVFVLGIAIAAFSFIFGYLAGYRRSEVKWQALKDSYKEKKK